MKSQICESITGSAAMMAAKNETLSATKNAPPTCEVVTIPFAA